MKQAISLITLVVGLSACGEDAADAEGVVMRPGSYEIVLGTMDLRIPGMAEEELLAAQREINMGYPNVSDECLGSWTLSGGVRGFIEDRLMENQHCLEDVVIADGVIEGRMSCTSSGGGVSELYDLDGTYDEDGFRITGSTRMDDPALPEGYAERDIEFRAVRIEDC